MIKTLLTFVVAWPAKPKSIKKYCQTSTAILVCCIFVGCTNAPGKTTDTTISLPAIIVEPEPIPSRPFATDTLYALLVAEMAGDRNRFDIMLNNYMQQAELTQDPGVTARATRLARYLESHASALHMSLLWTQLEPNNIEAHYTAAAELIHANHLLDAVEHAKFLLKHDETTGFDAIGARAQQGGDINTTQKLISVIQPLLEKHPGHHDLHLGISLLYQHAGNLEQALTHTRAAINLKQNDFQTEAQETRILHQMGRQAEAIQKLGELVKRHPENNQLQLQYARNLLKSDLPKAQIQFEQLLEKDPKNADLALTLALIEYERGLLQQAHGRFLGLSDNSRHDSTAHYYLGRIELTLKHLDKAIYHFGQVKPGTNYLPALSQLCDIFISQNKIDYALALIQDQRQHTPAENIEHIKGLYTLEARTLAGQGQYLNAIETLNKAIEQFPTASNLIYTRGMLFTRINEIHKAELDLKQVLEFTPDNAAALNALGYTLADRTDRLDEAYSYIQKAYNLTPNDPAVRDSLGWVEYLRGNHNLALQNLRVAMDGMPDHEIAAHLGEVLWVTGKRKEAYEVWKNGLNLNPNSSVIRSTMKRLKATTND